MKVGWPSQTKLAALHDREDLTSRPDPEFHELAQLAGRLCQMPFAKISVADDSGGWLAFGIDPDEGETPTRRACPLCCHTIRLDAPVTIIRDTHADPALVNLPNSRGIRFFAAVPLVMPDGQRVGLLWVADRIPREWKPIHTGLLSALARQVVTQLSLRRANTFLAQRESELRSIIETSGEGIYGVDTQGRCTFINAACVRMLGYGSAEELLGREMHDVIHYAHANGAPYEKDDCTVLMAFREGIPIRLEDEVFWRADGTPIWVLYTSSPLHRDGQLIGAVINFVDVTEQRRRRVELAEAARVRDRFTSVLGHDLRGPLSTVLMGGQLIANTAPLESTRAIAVRVTHAAERMQRLIRDLLDFIRVREGGTLAMSPRATNLGQIARDIVGELELANPGRTFEVQVDGDATGTWDPDRIAQVCSNLLGNALHHGAPREPIVVVVRCDPDHATVSVANAGPPIPDEIRPYLFDPYRRGRTEKSVNQHGLGLGLFIVREIALAHGGDVAFSSTSSGTTFTVQLPRHESALASTPPASAVPACA